MRDMVRMVDRDKVVVRCCSIREQVLAIRVIGNSVGFELIRFYSIGSYSYLRHQNSQV